MAKAPIEIRSLARSHTASALRTLTSIMEDVSMPPAARANAAQYLLDRGWGKAVQAIEVSGELTSKVIRAPAMATSTAEWHESHVPVQHH